MDNDAMGFNSFVITKREWLVVYMHKRNYRIIA